MAVSIVNEGELQAQECISWFYAVYCFQNVLLYIDLSRANRAKAE